MPRELPLPSRRRPVVDDTPGLRVSLRGRVPTMQLRRLLADAGRDVTRCERCGSHGELQVHHRLSLARGGTNEPGNLIVLCAACHAQTEREGDAPISPP